MLRIILIVIVLALAVGAVKSRFDGAHEGPVERATLADLAADPGRFEGRLVSVSGRVDNRMSVLGWGGVRLVDAAGRELVVLGAATPPAPGEKLTVTGTYLTAFSIGDATAQVIIVAER